MRKKLVITLLIGVALTLTGCDEGQSKAASTSIEGYTVPNVSRVGVSSFTYGGQYNYLIDENTDVVYLEYHGADGSSSAITVMFDSDGTVLKRNDIRPR